MHYSRTPFLSGKNKQTKKRQSLKRGKDTNEQTTFSPLSFPNISAIVKAPTQVIISYCITLYMFAFPLVFYVLPYGRCFCQSSSYMLCWFVRYSSLAVLLAYLGLWFSKHSPVAAATAAASGNLLGIQIYNTHLRLTESKTLKHNNLSFHEAVWVLVMDTKFGNLCSYR